MSMPVITANATALHAAAGGEFDRVVSTLLEAGADLDPVDAGGATPLIRAIFGDRPDIARLLIVRGANVNADVHRGDGRR